MSWLHLYDTVKTVRIHDRKLGLMYYTLLLVVFLYVIMYNIVYQKGYFEYETPVGAISTEVIREGSFDVAGLHYCSESTSPSRVAKNCIIWDQNEAVVAGDNSLTIATYVVDHIEERVCAKHDKYCATVWKEIEKENYYLADIEEFQVHVHHSMQAPMFFEESGHSTAFAEGNKHMAGVLISGHGNSKLVRRFPKGSCDTFSVKDLIEAAEVNLDSLSDAADHAGETYRDRGMILHVDLAYNNIRCDMRLSCAFGSTPITYRYRLYRVPEAEYGLEDVKELNATHRLRREKHGIHLKIAQTGKIGRFSMLTLMLHLCSGLGMMALGTVIVDFVAIYVLPNKHFYTKNKFRFVISDDEQKRQQKKRLAKEQKEKAKAEKEEKKKKTKEEKPKEEQEETKEKEAEKKKESGSTLTQRKKK